MNWYGLSVTPWMFIFQPQMRRGKIVLFWKVSFDVLNVLVSSSSHLSRLVECWCLLVLILFYLSWEVILDQVFQRLHVNIWYQVYPKCEMCYMKQNLFFCIIVVIIQKLPTYVSNFALCASQNILLHHFITTISLQHVETSLSLV